MKRKSAQTDDIAIWAKEGKERRATLDFIEHRAIRELGEEAPGIIIRKAAHVR